MSQRPRGFLNDLLASFHFVGSKASAVAFLATVLACAVPWIIGTLIAGLLPWPISLLIVVITVGYVVAFAIHFLWSTLTRTARGEDEIPVFDPTWDLWEDALKPLFWLLVVTSLCALPALTVWSFIPAGYPLTPVLMIAAVVLGSLFWPVAVLAVSLGESLLFLRPDWLIRGMLGIGPEYLLAWLQILVVVSALAAFYAIGPLCLGGWLVEEFCYPIAAAVVMFYLGFVLFRSLGLLHRHFRHRFPWKF